jgi:cytochrome c oxidase subunit 2
MRRWCAALVSLCAVSSALAGAQPGERRVIRINAERFAFSPSQITIDAGEEVELRLKSDDTSHGFRLVGTDTNVAIPKRGKGDIAVIIRLDQPGRYTFECNRMCGAGHNFMRGELIVRERETARSASAPYQRQDVGDLVGPPRQDGNPVGPPRRGGRP